MLIRLFTRSVLIWMVSGSAMAACSSERIVGLWRDAVVKVETDDGAQVSGVVVAQDRVVTVWHGLSGAGRASAVVAGERQDAAILHADTESDLVLLAVPTGAVNPVTLLDRHLVADESVWVFGWPAGKFQTVGEGRYLGDWRGSLRFSSLVAAGQSGGALIACQDGREMLAGLVTGFGAAELAGNLQRIPHMSLAVSAAQLLTFFNGSHAVRLQAESPDT